MNTSEEIVIQMDDDGYRVTTNSCSLETQQNKGSFLYQPDVSKEYAVIWKGQRLRLYASKGNISPFHCNRDNPTCNNICLFMYFTLNIQYIFYTLYICNCIFAQNC